MNLINEALKLKNAETNEIFLGGANGWGSETFALYKSLCDIAIPGTQSTENLGRCYNKHKFDVVLGDETYKVVYTVDSSD